MLIPLVLLCCIIAAFLSLVAVQLVLWVLRSNSEPTAGVKALQSRVSYVGLLSLLYASFLVPPKVYTDQNGESRIASRWDPIGHQFLFIPEFVTGIIIEDDPSLGDLTILHVGFPTRINWSSLCLEWLGILLCFGLLKIRQRHSTEA